MWGIPSSVTFLGVILTLCPLRWTSGTPKTTNSEGQGVAKSISEPSLPKCNLKNYQLALYVKLLDEARTEPNTLFPALGMLSATAVYLFCGFQSYYTHVSYVSPLKTWNPGVNGWAGSGITLGTPRFRLDQGPVGISQEQTPIPGPVEPKNGVPPMWTWTDRGYLAVAQHWHNTRI